MRSWIAGFLFLIFAAPASALTIDFPGAEALEVGLGPFMLTFTDNAAFDLGDFLVTLDFLPVDPTVEFIPDPGMLLTALEGGAYELLIPEGPVTFTPLFPEVPEPGAAVLALIGLAGLLSFESKRRMRA